MTWFDPRTPKKRVRHAIFAERAPAKKKAVPAWIAAQQATSQNLTGWLSSRPGPPTGSAPHGAPPAGSGAPNAGAGQGAPPVGVAPLVGASPLAAAAPQVPGGPFPGVGALLPGALPGAGHGGAPLGDKRAGAALRPGVPPRHDDLADEAMHALEARALSFEQAEGAVRASIPVIPGSPQIPLDAIAPRVSETASLIAAQQSQSARLEAAITALEKGVEALAAARKQAMEESEEQLVLLAATMARRVIGREVAVDPQVLLSLAAEGIEALGERDRVIVRFGLPDESELLPAMVERLKRRAPRCEVIQDPSLGPGDCIVESEFGQVDESVDTRLNNVLRALLPDDAQRFG